MGLFGNVANYFGFGQAPAVSADPRDSRPRPAAATARPRRANDLNEIVTLEPTSYANSTDVAAHFRTNVPVIVNIVNLSEVEARRMVDFMLGLTQGLNGKIARVTEKVFLLSPHNVSVTDNNEQGGNAEEDLVGY
jgi:cell division inhibitor SepF